MKTYVITVSEKFPKTHKRAGQYTAFVQLIKDKMKLHTIRGNYDLWRKRFDEIEKGNAILSVRVWTDKPYKSKQKEVFRFDKSDGIGIEKLEFEKISIMRQTMGFNASVDIRKLCFNDGLTFYDFTNWFKGYDLSKPLAIIHFTDFRYFKK